MSVADMTYETLACAATKQGNLKLIGARLVELHILVTKRANSALKKCGRNFRYPS
jgi:hypothetical protein